MYPFFLQVWQMVSKSLGWLAVLFLQQHIFHRSRFCKILLKNISHSVFFLCVHMGTRKNISIPVAAAISIHGFLQNFIVFARFRILVTIFGVIWEPVAIVIDHFVGVKIIFLQMGFHINRLKATPKSLAIFFAVST